MFHRSTLNRVMEWLLAICFGCIIASLHMGCMSLQKIGMVWLKALVRNGVRRGLLKRTRRNACELLNLCPFLLVQFISLDTNEKILYILLTPTVMPVILVALMMHRWTSQKHLKTITILSSQSRSWLNATNGSIKMSSLLMRRGLKRDGAGLTIWLLGGNFQVRSR